MPTSFAAAPRGSWVSASSVITKRTPARRGRPGGEIGGLGRAAQQPIELLELAALPLPADPEALALAPHPPAVEEMEARLAVGGGAVLAIQLVDARSRGGEQRLVSGHRRRIRVRPIREQREAEMAVGVREVVDAEPAHLLGDLRLAGEERGHRDQGLPARGHARGEREPRQGARRKHFHDRAVDERDCHVGGREHREHGQHDHERGGDALLLRIEKGQAQEEPRDDGDAARHSSRWPSAT